jgi:hypothetical protein
MSGGLAETACSVGGAEELSGIARNAGAGGIGEFSEKLKDANGGELDGGFGDFAAVIFAKVIEDKIEVGLHFFEPESFFEVILEAAVSPTGEVRTADFESVLVDFGDDCVVGDSVIEHGIDGVAEFLREPGDVAIATADGLLLLGAASAIYVI